jgi:triphosphoribosyl-dephospho-CoA synthase
VIALSARREGAWSGDAAAHVEADAQAALEEELALSPKPGLVSPGERGAHRDMDAGTFRASLRALRGVFGEAARIAAVALELELEPGPATAWALHALGVEAEARMLRATAGVNTHRGAIFALGLLAAAAGRAAGRGAPPCVPALRAEVTRLGAAVRRELPSDPASHGAVAAARHHAGGARAEAAAGFPHVFDVALPALAASVARGAPRRAAAIQCLLTLVARLGDTNLLHRGGLEGLAFARAGAAAFLARGGVHRPRWEAEVLALHRAFVARRLSPGGSADLLAAALFVERWSASALDARRREVGGRR